MNDKDIKIRGHHLLCLLHFEGKGYSKEFIENMKIIKEKLDEGYKFLLVVKRDSICNKCPYLKNDKCLKENYPKEIENKDKEIINHLNLIKNEKYNYFDIKKTIFKKITRSNFENFCKDCSWFLFCSEKNLFR